MRRRDFIRMGLFSIPVIYGFPESLFRFTGKDTLVSNDLGMEDYDFFGSYLGEIIDDMILMPEEFILSLRKYKFDLVAPPDNGFLLLIPKETPQLEMFKEIKSLELFKQKTPFLHEENAQITDNGSLLIPRRMQKFAGIRPGKLTIVGHESMIEIQDTTNFDAS